MNLTDLQLELKSRYGAIDESSGSLFLLSVLVEECGELASAIRRHEATAGEEIGDVIFCALSIANLLNANVEQILQDKYLHRRFEDVTESWTDIKK